MQLAESGKVIRTLQISKGIKTKEIIKALEMTHPTYTTRLANPLRFTGEERIKLSEIFNIDIESIDMIINGRTALIIKEV